MLVRYYIRVALTIGVVWTLFDYTTFLSVVATEDATDHPFSNATEPMKWSRLLISLVGHFFLGYLLVFPLKVKLRQFPLWLSFLVKTIILAVFSAIIVSFVFFFIYVFLLDFSMQEAWKKYVYYVVEASWMYNYLMNRSLLFIVTLIALEIGEKYSPGVFLDIFLGKYKSPKEQNRIIIFIDLINSTPIAEQLGHKEYFKFIRDFIHHVSTALLEYNGLIYQYVGDEIVVSWIHNKANRKNSINSLRRARIIINREANCYLKTYGIKPEFRAGIHCGMVTIGEIGLVKKDLAISGDAMNTTARIRSMTGKLDVQFLASKEFIDSVQMTNEECRSLGFFEMKGMANEVELFSILEEKTMTRLENIQADH